MATTTIYVSGREVTYERFINDLAAKLADVMKSRSEMPEYICQRQAFRLFGAGLMSSDGGAKESSRLTADSER